MVWNWMGDAFGWTTPSQREPTPPLLGCTWVDPPSPRDDDRRERDDRYDDRGYDRDYGEFGWLGSIGVGFNWPGWSPGGLV